MAGSRRVGSAILSQVNEGLAIADFRHLRW
jgi:hypothetical protein